MLTEPLPERIQTTLDDVQHDLFDVGAEISIPGYEKLKMERVAALENTLDELNELLPSLKEFILPGGVRAAAICHLSRTICRRAERALIKLNRDETVTMISLQYLNRLSDLLFVMCRSINQAHNVPDVLWHNKP